MSDMKPQPCPACGEEACHFGFERFFCATDGCWLTMLSGASLEQWNRLRLAPAASDETIPVRIAVVVDEQQNWAAAGWTNASEADAAWMADGSNEVSGVTRTTIITALAYKLKPQSRVEVTGDSQAQ